MLWCPPPPALARSVALALPAHGGPRPKAGASGRKGRAPRRLRRRAPCRPPCRFRQSRPGYRREVSKGGPNPTDQRNCGNHRKTGPRPEPRSRPGVPGRKDTDRSGCAAVGMRAAKGAPASPRAGAAGIKRPRIGQKKDGPSPGPPKSLSLRELNKTLYYFVELEPRFRTLPSIEMIFEMSVIMMSLIGCTQDCHYQRDGYCTLEYAPVAALERKAVPNDYCVNFTPRARSAKPEQPAPPGYF